MIPHLAGHKNSLHGPDSGLRAVGCPVEIITHVAAFGAQIKIICEYKVTLDVNLKWFAYCL